MAWPNVYGLDTTRFNSAGASTTAKPTILLVHDAFQSAAHLELLARELRTLEYKVFAPQLPSSGPYLVPDSLEADVKVLVDCAKDEIDHGRSVVIMAHGYGGIPGCIAADRLDQYAMDRPRVGQITKLLLIAGVILKPNQAYYDVLDPSWAIARGGLLGAYQPGNVFYQDCPTELKAWAVSQVRPQNEDSLRTRVRAPGWNRLPVLYVVCENSEAIPSSAQHDFVALLQQYNRQTAVVGLPTGHCPFLTRARDVAQLIARISA